MEDQYRWYILLTQLPHFDLAGQTALHRAINHGYFDIAILLLGYGASFEMNDFKLKSPVQYCCKPKNYVTHQQSQIKEQLVFAFLSQLIASRHQMCIT